MYLEENGSGRKMWSPVSVLQRGQLSKIQKEAIGFSSYEVDFDESSLGGGRCTGMAETRLQNGNEYQQPFEEALFSVGVMLHEGEV